MSATTRSLEETVLWLKRLNESVNKEVRGTMTPNMSGKGYEYTRSERVRDLTKEEWKQVLTCIQQHELPCEIGCTGFTWMLNVYGHSPLREERPNLLLIVEAKQVPIAGTQGSLGENEVALANLAWLTHSARNKEILDWYHLDAPREPSHYSY